MTLPMFGIPGEFRGDVQIFNRPCTVTNTQWETWRRPRGYSMLSAIIIGGGGGGGGGFTGIAGAARGGGGGGGSSGITRIMIPLWLLPEVLYIQVGAGGLGVGSGGGTAGSGVLSYLAVSPNNTPTNVIALSGAAAAVGGGTGTGAAVGAAGTAGTIAVIGSMPLAGIGTHFMIAGQVGIAGGAVAGANGSPTTIAVTSCITMGGAGGAGTTSADFVGGGITTIAGSLLSEYKASNSAAGSFSGSSGPMIWDPLFSFGGTGGSSSNTLAGGAGGSAAYGSGGGGGGGGTTGGRGGDGGSGLIIMTCW